MKDKDLQDMVGKTAGEFKSEADFEESTKALRKEFWESTLNALILKSSCVSSTWSATGLS